MSNTDKITAALRAISGGATVSAIVRIAGGDALTKCLELGFVERFPGRLELTQAGADRLVSSILSAPHADDPTCN